MIDDANGTSKEEKQTVSTESSTPTVSQNGESGQSTGKRPERRPIIAAIMAVVAAVTTLFLPTLLLLGTNGEICEGYQVDVGSFYAGPGSLAVVAAALAFAIGMTFPASGFSEGKTRSWRVGCGIVGIAVGGVVCSLASCVLATYPGC